MTKKVEEFRWIESCQGAFDELKTKLTEAPILCYPSSEERNLFILDTDASDVGVGAVLSQVQDGEKVIAYASKTLSPSQRQYCVTYRELFAVVLFVKQFRHYLLGRKFKMRMDHVSLKWLMRFRDAEAMVGRWVLYLSLFVCGISLTSGQLSNELFPDCTRSCFSQVVSRRRGGDRIYEMRGLFVAVGPNARFIVLPHWDNMP